MTVLSDGKKLGTKRKDRLSTFRELLAMTKHESTASSSTESSKTPTGSVCDFTEECYEAAEEEAEAPKASTCQCRCCKGEMELVGRLRGTESR